MFSAAAFFSSSLDTSNFATQIAAQNGAAARFNVDLNKSHPFPNGELMSFT